MKEYSTVCNCAVCGRPIYQLEIGNRTYGICRKCQVIRYYKDVKD